MKVIIRAGTYNNVANAQEYRDDIAAGLLRAGYSPTKLALSTAIDQPKIYGTINQGRWIVCCPFCNGAELGDPAIPYFACRCCGNERVAGRFIKVIYPDNWREIENALLYRPRHVDMNWLPHESLDDLLEENRAHGLGGSYELVNTTNLD